MFPHALDSNGYPKPGFLRGSRTTLECYDDGKLVNHGSIKLRLQHYSEGSFQDHSFYVVETRTPKPIIVGHPASIWYCYEHTTHDIPTSINVCLWLRCHFVTVLVIFQCNKIKNFEIEILFSSFSFAKFCIKYKQTYLEYCWSNYSRYYILFSSKILFGNCMKLTQVLLNFFI